VNVRAGVRRRVGRLLAVAAFGLGVQGTIGLCIGVPSAQAHSAENSPSSNYQTTIRSIAPTPAPFTMRVIEAGSRLQVTWKSGDPLVILGYEEDPYLRIGPDGVEENLESSATYINRSRSGAADIPDDIDATRSPKWRRISGEPVARWHDHRAHWMGSQRPDVVRADPGRIHRIQEWSTVIVQGSTRYTVSGDLDWVPGPSGRGKLLAAAACGMAIVGAALWAGRHVRRRALVTGAVGVALAGLVAIDVFHLFGIVAAVQGPGFAGRVISVGYASIAAWVIAVAALVLLLRRRVDALYLVTFAAGLIALVGGLADLSSLSRSALAFAFDRELGRWSVALSLGGGIGIAAASVLLTRPLEAPARALPGTRRGSGRNLDDLDDDPADAPGNGRVGRAGDDLAHPAGDDLADRAPH
jgi:hypothetical protein